jgi:LPXTG-motif cell wall-anchored protein
MLLMAIALFAVSAFLYSYTYQPPAETLAATTSLPEYPYQNYAFSFVGFGSLLMLTASLSYLKRRKTACVNIRLQSSAKNRAD